MAVSAALKEPKPRLPDTPKGSVSFDWVHEVEITNCTLRTTLGLRGHTGNHVAEPRQAPGCSLHSDRVTTETRYIYIFRTGTFIDSQTSPGVFLRLCGGDESWAPRTHAPTCERCPASLGVTVTRATCLALETWPFKGSLSPEVLVSRARPRRRQSEHGPGCTGAVARRACSGLEAGQ